jgi:hypothetical protein
MCFAEFGRRGQALGWVRTGRQCKESERQFKAGTHGGSSLCLELLYQFLGLSSGTCPAPAPPHIDDARYIGDVRRRYFSTSSAFVIFELSFFSGP